MFIHNKIQTPLNSTVSAVRELSRSAVRLNCGNNRDFIASAFVYSKLSSLDFIIVFDHSLSIIRWKLSDNKSETMPAQWDRLCSEPLTHILFVCGP